MNIDYRLLIESFESTMLNQHVVELVRKLKDKGLKTGMITDNKNDISC